MSIGLYEIKSKVGGRGSKGRLQRYGGGYREGGGMNFLVREVIDAQSGVHYILPLSKEEIGEEKE